MNIRIGIYDLLALVIPGSIFTLALYFFLRLFGLNLLISNITDLLTHNVFISIGVFYILGFVVDKPSKFFDRFFTPKDLHKTVVTQFNERHPTIKFLFRKVDWFILLTFIKHHNLEIGRDIEQLNAVSIMLKKTAFSILCLTLSITLNFCISKSWLMILLTLFLIPITILLELESIKFKRWFYLSIYQSLISIVIDRKELPIEIQKVEHNHDD